MSEDFETVSSRFLRTMLQAQEAVDAIVPRSPSLASDGQRTIFGLWLGCRHLHEGIGLLLDTGLYAEATILLRTILDDAIRLGFFANHEDRLEDWAALYMLDSLRYEARLDKTAQDLGLSIAGPRREVVSNEQRHWKARAKELGLGSDGLPSLKVMTEELGGPEAEWLHRYASQASHSNRIAMSLRLRFAFGLAGPEEQVHELIRVGYEATEGFLLGTEAAGVLLDWPLEPGLRGSLMGPLATVAAAAGLPVLKVASRKSGGSDNGS